MESEQMTQCFVCDKDLQSCDIDNDFSREDFAVTVRKIIGDDYLLIFGEQDHLCRACQNLLLRIVRLEVEEKTNTLAMRVLLQMKYSLDFSNNQSSDASKKSCQEVLQSDHETEHCFVCNKLLQSSDFNTDYSRKDLVCVIRKIVGDGYFMVIKEEDHLCQACQDLLLKIQSKSAELRTMTLAMRALLRIKYSLDFHNVGVLGSSFEDSSDLPLQVPAKSNSVRGTKSKMDLFSLNIKPSTDIFTPKKDLVRKKKKCLDIPSPKTDSCNLNSAKSLFSEELIYEVSVKNNSANKKSLSAIKNLPHPKPEDSTSHNSPTSLRDNSHQENCPSERENPESKPKIGLHSIDTKNYVKCKVYKPHKCGRCKFKYTTPEELESHNIEMRSKEDLYCNICDFNFHLKNLINQHNSNHSPFDMKRQCQLCNRAIYDRLHLRYHMYTVHRGEPTHKCSYCNRSFLWKRQLNRHFYKCHEERPTFTCEQCKKVYADKVKYLKHIEYFHRKSYSCKMCLKSFNNIDSLILHEKTHKKITTYKCKYCFKKYRTLENRRLHEEQHSGNFEYRCNKCDLGFQELIWFERHKAKNTCSRSIYGYSSRPTMCEICGKMFANKLTFKNHHLLHYNPHPFECDICNKKLRYKTKLYYHKKRYHSQTLTAATVKKPV